MRFFAECGVEVMPSDVYADDSGGKISYWHKYTDRQVRTLRDVCRMLAREYSIAHVLCHSDITPRKIDPGPALEGALREIGYLNIQSLISNL